MSTIPTDAEARRDIKNNAPSLETINALRQALSAAWWAKAERVEISLTPDELRRMIESAVTTKVAYEACMSIAAERDALLAGAGSAKRRKRQPTATE